MSEINDQSKSKGTPPVGNNAGSGTKKGNMDEIYRNFFEKCIDQEYAEFERLLKQEFEKPYGESKDALPKLNPNENYFFVRHIGYTPGNRPKWL